MQQISRVMANFRTGGMVSNSKEGTMGNGMDRGEEKVRAARG